MAKTSNTGETGGQGTTLYAPDGSEYTVFNEVEQRRLVLRGYTTTKPSEPVAAPVPDGGPTSGAVTS